MKQEICIIAALADNLVIGNNGQIPWRIPEDLKRFKELTTPHPIIMGRITHESIGRVLSGRTNIVITSNPDYQSFGCIVVHSLEEALKKSEGNDKVFIIGGEKIYKQALPIADRLFLTKVRGEFEGDTFFPDYSDFKNVCSSGEWQESNGFTYQFLELIR